MTSLFPDLCWNWQKDCPPVHIYFSDMWEDIFVPYIYDICHLFLGSMCHNIFKGNAPTFSVTTRDSISLHDVGEYFSYFRIWGSNTVHLLSRIVPNCMVLQEFAFQTVIDGAHKKLPKHKRKTCPNFPMYIDSLAI